MGSDDRLTQFDPGHEGGYMADISADGKYVATAGRADSIARLWNLADKKIVREWKIEGKPIHWSVRFVPNGRSLIVVDMEQRRRVARLDEKANEPTWLWDDQSQSIDAVSANGQIALIYDGNITVRSVNLNTRKEIGSIELPSTANRYLSVSADGRYGVASSASIDNAGPARVYVFRLPDPPAAKK